MAQDGHRIIESTATDAWRAVRSVFDNPERNSCAGGVKIPGTGLSVSLGVSRTAALKTQFDYREAKLVGDFCVVVLMYAIDGEIVLGEPDDRQYFTPGEWGPIIFQVYDQASDNVFYQYSYAGGDAIEAVAEKHPDSF